MPVPSALHEQQAYFATVPIDEWTYGPISTGDEYFGPAPANSDQLFGDEFLNTFLDLINQYTMQQQQASQASADRAMEFSAEQAELQRKFNAAEAQKARDYSTEMSNTAYQRAMKDLEAAGLNPKLVGQLGAASTPSSSAASAGSSPSGISASMAQGQIQALSGLLSTYVSNAASLDRQQNDFAVRSIWKVFDILVALFS